jgi:hypothetical protein
MSRILKGARPPGKSRARFALTVGLAALMLGLAALAGPAPDVLLGAPCVTDCGTTTGGTTTGTIYRTLTVTVGEHGTVSESPASCTSAESPCAWKYPSLDTAHPTATPDSGYTFTGWGEACTGTAACSITMSANKSVSASFADRTAPPAPTISAPAAGQTFVSNSSGSPNVSVAFARSDPGVEAGTAKFRCQLDSFSSMTCSSPWYTGLLPTGEHTVHVWAEDAAGNRSSAATRTFRAVNRPETAISGTPAEGALVSSESTAFQYESATGTSFDCKLDDVSVPCNSDLAPGEGAHTLSVRAGISPGDGNTYLDETPAVRHWTVDSKPPDTSIDSGPPQTTTATTAELAFSGADPDPGTAIHFECRLDEGIYRTCTSPIAYSGLGGGMHTALVRTVDAAGNVDPTPASHSWKVGSDSGGGSSGGGSAGPSGPTAAPPPGGGGPAGSTGSGPTEAPGRLGRIKWRAHGSRIELRSLRLTGLASGSRVIVSCKGPGCPFKRRKARVSGGKAQLAGAFHHRPLRQGTRIELQITAPGSAPRTIRITIRAHRKPQIASD